MDTVTAAVGIGILAYLLIWDWRITRQLTKTSPIEVYYDDDNTVVRILVEVDDLNRIVRKHISELPKERNGSE